MAINKNFVVKNGIQVADSLIYGDSTTGNVGVGTTLPLSTLDVRGRINATSIGSTTLYVTGISTLSVVGVTTLNAQQVNVVTGIITTISGTSATYTNLNGTTLNAVTGVVTTISGTTANYTNISVGSSLSINGVLYMNGSPVGMGTTGVLSVAGLTVSGVSTFNQISIGATTGISGQVLQSTGTGVTWAPAGASIGLVIALGG